jgi:hypothetical protein
MLLTLYLSYLYSLSSPSKSSQLGEVLDKSGVETSLCIYPNWSHTDPILEGLFSGNFTLIDDIMRKIDESTRGCLESEYFSDEVVIDSSNSIDPIASVGMIRGEVRVVHDSSEENDDDNDNDNDNCLSFKIIPETSNLSNFNTSFPSIAMNDEHTRSLSTTNGLTAEVGGAYWSSPIEPSAGPDHPRWTPVVPKILVRIARYVNPF